MTDDSVAPTSSSRRRALLSASLAHAAHDGMTDLIYVLLPIWQSQFGLSFALAGLARGLYSAAMAGLQVPASRLALRLGRKTLLVAGTVLAALGYLLAGQAGGFVGVCLALLISGCGASTQHPLASSLVADNHEGSTGARQALATYNFAGDLGKMLVPALVGLLLAWMNWQHCVTLIAGLGLLVALTLFLLIPAAPPRASDTERHPHHTEPSGKFGSGFNALLATGFIDSATRMGFLTFLPFILRDKGAGTASIGLALSLLFVGGAFGKLACGYLGSRYGMLKTVWLSESGTAMIIVAILALPLTAALAILPLLGIFLNGTSSVLYGTVPELVGRGQRDAAFARFYTGTIGGGALAPFAFGALGDVTGIPLAMTLVAGMVLLTLPLALRVNSALKSISE